MMIIGIAFLFLSGLYPLRAYLASLRKRAQKYSAVLSVLNRINDKILNTGTDLYEIFRDFRGDGELCQAMLECSRLTAKGRTDALSESIFGMGDDGEAFAFFISSFGRAPASEEKRKLAPLIERFSGAEEKLRLGLKDKERTAFVLYSSAFASLLLLAL